MNRNVNKIMVLLLVSIFFLTSCTQQNPVENDDEDINFVDRPMEASENEGIQMTKDGVKYLVHPSKILSGWSAPLKVLK